MKTITKIFIGISFILLTASCQREFTDSMEDIRINYGDLVYPASTHIFNSKETNNFVLKYTETSGEIIMSSNKKANIIEEGDILMLGPSSETPFGLLRKVQGITNSENEIKFNTTQATLDEAIIDGNITADFKLTRSDIYISKEIRGINLKSVTNSNEDILNIELDNVNLSENDDFPIILNGNLSVDISPSIDIHFKLHNPPKVYSKTDVTIESNINIDAEYNYENEKSVTIFEVYFNPIVIWGIVLVPKLEINAGYDGSFSTSISASANQTITQTYELFYEDGHLRTPDPGDWNVVEKQANISINGDASLNTYVGPNLSILIFGVVGPYVAIKGNLEFGVDINKNPWWDIYGSVNADIGLKGNIFGIDNIVSTPPIKLNKWLIAQANGAFSSCKIEGKVIEAGNYSPLQNVKISVGVGDKNNFTPYVHDYSNNNGDYELYVSPGEDYSIMFEKDGYITQFYKIQQEVTANGLIYHQRELLIDNYYSGYGNIGGIITDAFTGEGLGEVHVDLFKGHYISSGNPVGTVTTASSNGSYLFENIEAGYYTISLLKNGYSNSTFNVIVLGGKSLSNQNGTISPIIPENEWRIILTWGNSPKDLDSHITGPKNQTGRFHINFDKKVFKEDSFSAKLDVDDTDSYGPETITLKNINSGVYRYSIHDYSNKSSSSSSALSNSDAKVIVIKGNAVVQSFNVPNKGGTLWTVFEIRDKSLYSIDDMSYENIFSNVKSASSHTDAELIMKLPNK